jgi:curved DNA-binding protein CbpA
MNYYKEIIKQYHPDLNKNSRVCAVITKVANKLREENKLQELKNLHERLCIV